MDDVKLNVFIDSQPVITLEVRIDTKLQELMQHLKLFHSISTSVNDWECYSEKKQQYLKPNDNFQYTKEDILYISTKNDFTIKLDIWNVKENIKVNFTSTQTIKDIKKYIYNYLKIEETSESIIIEIYKDGILQSDNTITVSQLLKFKENLQKQQKFRNGILIYPFIEAKSVSNLQQIGQLQNDLNISSEVQKLKEQVDLKLKNLELLFMQILQASRINIFQKLEFYEQDITQILQVLKSKFNQKHQSQLIKQKVNLFNKQKEISMEHIKKIQTEFQKFQFKLQNEQQELYNKQQNSFDEMKIELETKLTLDQVYVNRELAKVVDIEVDSDITFEEILDYLELEFPDVFSQYTQDLGPIKKWVGLSTKLGRDVNLSEQLGEYEKDTIKFIPIHIFIKKGIKSQSIQMIELNIQFFWLKNPYKV